MLISRVGLGSAEHYFEMEHKQAADALTLYKSFCTQTKKVVEYLKYAKELNNIIDVPIPNLKHVGPIFTYLLRSHKHSARQANMITKLEN